MTTPRLVALSDLHVAFPPNRKIVSELRPGSDGDWLLLAGDVGELYPDIEWALRILSELVNLSKVSSDIPVTSPTLFLPIP